MLSVQRSTLQSERSSNGGDQNEGHGSERGELPLVAGSVAEMKRRHGQAQSGA